MNFETSSRGTYNIMRKGRTWRIITSSATAIRANQYRIIRSHKRAAKTHDYK